MASLICPDFFGCSSKLSFGETQRLARAVGNDQAGSDFSSISAVGEIVSSIDRVHRCAKEWDRFARIALNHAFGDVICAGAKPVQAMLSFEFGVDTPADEYAVCSQAFAQELAGRGIGLGKCHSSQTDGVTAVTISTLASQPSLLTSGMASGGIYLSRPIGALKIHYLAELGTLEDQNGVSNVLEYPENGPFLSLPWAVLTDVSGHGLLGAAAQVAEKYRLTVELELSPAQAITPEVLSLQVDCLQNALSSYGIPVNSLPRDAETIATLRETAGPFLGFVEDSNIPNLSAFDSFRIGRYFRGKMGVDVSWKE